ncbi:PEP-CTERM sorting domain-containing protein [Bythopirellula goksoeyrii]|uniref:Ice-binding protein C-terminal domain-containing protein n=1 Tax=Bythopirellula goksoeyrii TaxID=1400387 RepID=A0A5B9QEV6_9BACT|nr:PEP-CTERM sorting domain-containing protein [Bythopirellula goksoeyrii]QEG37548.1 hypothetical protein Pr1d_48940 [Bythopirellula goksoeyrii]
MAGIRSPGMVYVTTFHGPSFLFFFVAEIDEGSSVMKKTKLFIFLVACSLMCANSVEAAGFKISLGIRETGSTMPIFGNGGSSGGIEWVDKDAQTLTADGTWQLFTFTPNAAGALSAFAGGTADSLLSTDTGTIEHIRLLNDEGITAPFRVWIDDVTNTVASGPVVENFDSAALASEVMFNEPDFSGSTAGNLVAGGTTAVTDAMAFSGSQSLEVATQFNSNNPAGWLRLTTFNAANLPNPTVIFREPGAPNPTISFYAKATVIPEPASVLLMGISVIGLGFVRNRS